MVVPTPKESWCHRWHKPLHGPKNGAPWRVKARCPVACHQRFLCGSLQWIDLGATHVGIRFLQGSHGLAWPVYFAKKMASRSVLVEWFIMIFCRRLPPYVWLMHICPSLTAHLCVVKPTLRVIGDRKRESLPGPPQFPRYFKQIPAAATERRLWTKKT